LNAEPQQKPATSTLATAPVEEAGAHLTIDLGALAENWRSLAARAPGAETAAVVKADAYGIGIERAAPALAQAGCRTFFVAQISEGLRALAAVPGAIVYVLNGLLPGTAPRFAASGLRPVLGSGEEIAEWAAFCASQNMRLPAALHVDTGMNRLGLGIAEGLALAGDSRLAAFAPSLLMSHFVGSEESDHPRNARQIEAFDTVRTALPAIPASLANSSGIFLAQRPHFDLVRPGYALYGGNPVPGSANPMREVVRLEARILQTRWIEAGDAAGYNGRWTAHGRRRLATLSIGYADGYPRYGSASDEKISARLPFGEAIVAGQRCPFAGTVSMDLIIIDVTDVPANQAGRGTSATLIGDGLGVDEVGGRAGTIGYEILTRLGRRYARTYIEASR
jgi:alanine racemase